MASTNLYPLFTKGINENFLLKLKDYDPEWRRIFHVSTTGDRYVWHQGWEGYQLPMFRVPGAPVFQGSFQPSFSMQYVVFNYGLGDAIPEEDINDDLYAVIKYQTAKKGGAMARAFENLLQYKTSGYFATQGFASGTVAGMSDGKSLFNTAHPISASNLGTTFSNRPSTDADLSITTAIAAATALRTQKAPDNLTYLNNEIRAVVINPTNLYVAQQIYRGGWYPGTADRDVNYLPKDNVDIISWPYFTKSGSTGTNNAYFYIGNEHYLRFYMRSAPESKTDYDINTNSQIITMLCRFTFGADDPRGTWGSTGA